MSQFFITSIKLADYLVIPVASSAFDICGLSSLIEMINMINKDFSVLFVHNKIIRNAKMNGEIKEALESVRVNKNIGFFDVMFRQSYPKSSMLGLSVFEAEDSQAKGEIEFICNSIKEAV